MKLFFQNPRSEYLDSKNLQVSPEHTPVQRVLIALFTLIAFPVMLVVYPVGKLLLGALNLAAQFGFFLTDRIFHTEHDHDPAYTWQAVRAFISNELAAKVPHINATYRKFLYKLNGMRIGKGGFLGMGGILEDLHPENFVMEDGCCVSFGVTVVCHGPKQNIPNEKKTIILRKGAYVGAASILIPGIEIGEHATVGAGSVVTKDVPAGAVVAGAPARLLRYKHGYGPNGKTEEEFQEDDE